MHAFHCMYQVCDMQRDEFRETIKDLFYIKDPNIVLYFITAKLKRFFFTHSLQILPKKISFLPHCPISKHKPFC